MYWSPLPAKDGPSAVEAGSSGLVGMPSYFMSSFYPAETSGTGGSAEMMVPTDRAMAASKNHREAEKRRRERIKSHLDRLRTLLACDPKTDKASLLARAVEHVRDLKQRTAEIAEARLLPTEADEIVVVPGSSCSGRGPVVFEASVCCDDRTDLLPELIETLRSLRMRTLRAEIATLGGRVRNVMVLTGETDERVEDDGGRLLKDALVALVNRSGGSQDRSKRRRTMDPQVA
ncbi:transcription factor bHLH106-like [Iris pallida]|uniref:Transcription factor bHLH106-like n=1 Tax=Iris pallida TaxID=29817 RepID=A0AAX6IPR2_IRIPA|nr:transcription factor bHLH106-like [Iris pallida]